MSGLIDPKRNLLTTLLIGGIGVLAVVGVTQTVLMGGVDLDRIPMIGDAGIGDSQVELPETGLADIDEYTAITERPLFFSDRRLPVVEIVEAPDDPEEPDDPIQEDPVEALRAVVAGIIITPEMRLALVRDEAANKTVTLREGMSLDGEQAAWRIETIGARQVSFVSVDGRQSELELKINTAGLQAGSPGQVQTPASRRASQADEAASEERREAEAEAGQQPVANGAESDARERAEEVRRRVAERRAELRAEAERRAQQQRQRQEN